MKRWKWWVVVIGVVALLASACSGDNDAESETVDLPPPAEDVVLRVIVGQEVANDWTLEELDYSLPFATLTLDGDEQEGPLLLKVLEASGVVDWESMEVLGLGEGRTSEVTLFVNAPEVNETWILDVSNHGTLKLAAENLPREKWVRDVAELRIN
jgi:hypothetical protein